MTSKRLPDMLMDDHQYALLNSRQYDRRPNLNLQEREALTQAMALCTGDNETRLPQQLNSALACLLQPCKDILACLGASQKYCSVPIQMILQEMHARSTSYWAWSEDVWATPEPYLPNPVNMWERVAVPGQRTVRSSESIAAAQSRSLGRKDLCSVVSGTLVA